MAAERERLQFISESQLPTAADISALCVAGGKAKMKSKLQTTGNQ